MANEDEIEQYKINEFIRMLENKDSEMADSDNFNSMDFDLRIDNHDGPNSDAEGSPNDHRMHPAEIAAQLN